MTALNATVLPAVSTVLKSAASRLGPRELLAVAREEEQAVVDREPETCAGDEVEREHGDRDRRVRKPQHREGGDDREDARGNRQERRDHATEDPDAEDEEERERDQLRPDEVALRLPPDLFARDGRASDEPGYRPFDQRAARPVSLPFRRYAATTTEPAPGGSRRTSAIAGSRRRSVTGGRRVGRGRDDDDRRARKDTRPLREQLERAVALGALVLVVVVARAQPRRGARAEYRGGTASGRSGEDPPWTAPREIGEEGEHRFGHNA